jgi:hypothetical protein
MSLEAASPRATAARRAAGHRAEHRDGVVDAADREQRLAAGVLPRERAVRVAAALEHSDSLRSGTQ